MYLIAFDCLLQVPQEPVLFNGTLRANLDPFGTHSDEELRTALKQCHLLDFVEAQPGGLDMEIQASGGSFSLSLGQAQLISLARAVLNPSPLLILDEATAALDVATDRLVQQTIRSVFASRTVLCVAHRLDTIIDSDRILVMSEGRVAEFEAPLSLLQRDSIFRGLCEQTGAQYNSLYAAAEQHQRTLQALEVEAEREVIEGTDLDGTRRMAEADDECEATTTGAGNHVSITVGVTPLEAITEADVEETLTLDARRALAESVRLTLQSADASSTQGTTTSASVSASASTTPARTDPGSGGASESPLP